MHVNVSSSVKEAARRLKWPSAGILMAVTIAGCTKPQPPVETIRPVLVKKIGDGQTTVESVYAGEVRARYETKLGFRVSGKLVSRNVEVGSQVKAGDVLARLDERDLQLSAASYQAQLVAAMHDRDLAQSDLARSAELYQIKFTSKAELERKQNTLNTATAKVQQAQAQLATSSNQTAYTALRTDHAGVVIAIEAEVGQVVNAGQAIIRLARTDEKEVVISIPEQRVDELRAAKKISVRSWARPDVSFPGHVREIAPHADSVTRTYTAKIATPTATDVLRLGMTATVVITNDGGPAARVPLSAIFLGDGQSAVWVVDPSTNSVSLRPIQLGDHVANEAAVIAGLARDDLVVTAGVQMLRTGQKVALPGE
jgi:membrane fusion protein, multidrug efflux system